MRNLFFFCFGIIDWLLKIVIPVNSNRYCFFSSPDFTDNSYYLYNHILKHEENAEFIWLVRDFRSRQKIEEHFLAHLKNRPTTNKQKLIIKKKNTVSGYWSYLTSRYFFHTHGGFSFTLWPNKNRTQVSLWHGMPIKSIGKLNTVTPNPKPIRGDFHLATSHLFKYVIANCFRADPSRVLVSGLPRNDRLSQPINENEKQAIRTALSITEFGATVLWLPTYRSERIDPKQAKRARGFFDDIAPDTIQHIDGLAREIGITVLVKLHPLDPLNHRTDINLGQHIRLLSSNELLDKNIQLYDLLAFCDGLVSDLSSVIIDFMLTRKPIGTLGYREETYKRNVLFPPNYVLNSRLISPLDSLKQRERFFRAVAKKRRIEIDKNDGFFFLHSSDKPEACANIMAKIEEIM